LPTKILADFLTSFIAEMFEEDKVEGYIKELRSMLSDQAEDLMIRDKELSRRVTHYLGMLDDFVRFLPDYLSLEKEKYLAMTSRDGVRTYSTRYAKFADVVGLAFVERENEILIWAATSGIISEECSRCLGTFEHKFSVEFEIFCDKIGSRTREEGAARESETFVVFHDGRTLELAPCVREAIVLSLPIKPLCNENCKGLCPVCGTNLNKNTCTCDSRKVDPRWSILEKLKEKKEES